MMRWLDGDEPGKVVRLAGLDGVVSYRHDFLGNAFAYFEPVKGMQDRCDVGAAAGVADGSGKCVLNKLDAI